MVTAEQIKPYLDSEDGYWDSNESYMLPVLVKYEGHAHVDDQGRILYEFEKLPPRQGTNVEVPVSLWATATEGFI